MWRRKLGVGGITIEILSECRECSRDIQSITALYPDSAEESDLLFSIKQNKNISLKVDDEQLWKGTDSGEITAAFEVHFYTRIVQKLTPELSSIHSACVGVHGNAWMFAGVSDAGKSSICTKALLEGCSYLSDEFSLLNEAGEIEPFPRPLQWGKEEHPAFPHAMMKDANIKKTSFQFPDAEGKTVTALLWLPEKIQRKPLPLHRLIFPRFDASFEIPELQSIRRGEALMELPQHLHYQQRADIMLKTLNHRIPKDVEFYRLYFADIHEAWTLLKRLSVS